MLYDVEKDSVEWQMIDYLHGHTLDELKAEAEKRVRNGTAADDAKVVTSAWLALSFGLALLRVAAMVAVEPSTIVCPVGLVGTKDSIHGRLTLY